MGRATIMRVELDPLIHAPTRLQIIALLSIVDRVEFARVRDQIAMTDSALSKQVTLLEAAGYVSVVKGAVGRRPRTWLLLTTEGRQAFDSHVTNLRRIIGQG
jgi:DNA-binding MarR family transcriptional regulator